MPFLLCDILRYRYLCVCVQISRLQPCETVVVCICRLTAVVTEISVGHLESKERLLIQPAQLFNFGTHSTILHTVRTWHHRTFTSS